MKEESRSKARQPSMEFEQRTEALLGQMLPRVDPSRAGSCIEIGVGTYHWYCDLFAKAGYHSVAIEPVPAGPFIQRLGEGGILFYEGVVGEHDGMVTVYLGKDGDTNLSSVRRDWWAATEHTRTVVSMTLATVIARSGIGHITCLKVDAEGSEARILKQLLGFPPHLLPRLIVFEFGAAVWTAGKWLDQFYVDTMECLRILRACGYDNLRTIDVFSEERFGHLQLDLDPDIYFGRDSQAGNGIAQLETIR
jgi:FkbM family methyltransferase